MRRNVAAGIASNEQGEYCRAALQRSDRKEPRYKWPTLLYFFRCSNFYLVTINWLHQLRVATHFLLLFIDARVYQRPERSLISRVF